MNLISIKEKISESMSNLDKLYSEYDTIHRYEQDNEPYFSITKEELESSIGVHTNMIYFSFCSYLEEINHIEYLKEFKKEIYPRIQDHKLMFEIYFNGNAGELLSITQQKIWHQLNPYEILNNDEFLRIEKSIGIFYLEKILRNTERTLLKLSVLPTSEPSIYKAIKVIVENIFISSISPKSNFFKTFKEYKPDVLIPEINAAVEYKYAKTEENLKKQVEEILVDVEGYKNDSDYKIFYAVFYVKEDFWGIDKFNQVWKEMNFPRNWKGIYIIGR